MKEAGYTHKMAQPSLAEDGGKNSKIFPSMTVDHKSMPHLKKHNVGDTGHMHIKYKVTSQHQYKSGDGDTGMDITHYEPAKRVKGEKESAMEDKAEKDEEAQPKAKQG